MRHLVAIVAAAAGAAVTMYYFDPDMGRRRRAMLRGDLRHAGNRLQGVRDSERPPATDAQLRDRLRTRLGHWVSHPAAVEVTVQDGAVRLSGSVLAAEQDGLLLRVRDTAGVKRVINALTAHESPRELTAARAETAM